MRARRPPSTPSRRLTAFLGLMLNGYWQAGSFIQSMSGLSPGSHTVQTFIYTNYGAQIAHYAIIYRVYTP